MCISMCIYEYTYVHIYTLYINDVISGQQKGALFQDSIPRVAHDPHVSRPLLEPPYVDEWTPGPGRKKRGVLYVASCGIFLGFFSSKKMDLLLLRFESGDHWKNQQRVHQLAVEVPVLIKLLGSNLLLGLRSINQNL